MDSLRSKLKKYRADRNLSQQAFSEIVGLSRTQITQLESGSRKPTLNIITKIATATNTDLTYWIETNDINIEQYIGLDIVIDKLIEYGDISPSGDISDKAKELLFIMIQEEIKLKLLKKASN